MDLKMNRTQGIPFLIMGLGLPHKTHDTVKLRSQINSE